MASEWDDVLGALGLHTESSGEPVALPSALQSQVAGFPERGANLLMGVLGPLGEAGNTLGEMLRTRSVDPRLLPQIAGGIMLGTMAPSGAETGAVKDLSEAAIEAALVKNPGASIFDLAGTKSEVSAGESSPWPSPYGPIGGKYAPGDLTTVFKLPEKSFPAEMPFQPPPQAQQLGFVTPAAHGTRLGEARWETPKIGLPIAEDSSQYGTQLGLAHNEGDDAFKLPDDELGVHFGSPQQASNFSANVVGGGYLPRTYPTVLQTGKSLELPDLGTWHLNKILGALHGLSEEGSAESGTSAGRELLDRSHIGEFPRSETEDMEDIGDLRSYLASKGYDSVNYINDVEGKGQRSYIMFKPSLQAPDYVAGVRSPFAKFDPSKLSWPELAAGLGGASTLPLFFDDSGQPLIRTK